MLYPILTLGWINITGETSRIVAAVGDLYYSELFSYGYIYQVIFYVSFIIPLYTIRNKTFSSYRLPISETIRFVLLLILLLFFPIAYPSVFGFGAERFGSGGSVIIILNALIILSRRKKFTYIDYITISLNLFALFSGERADTILVLFLFYIIESDGKVVYEKIISDFKVMIILISLLFVGLISGMSRVGGELSLNYLLYYFFNQGTVVDVIHVYMSSLWYVNKFGYNFEPLMNFIFSFLPFNSIGGASSSYNVTSILRYYIPNVGGGLFYTAGYVVFGIFGGALFSFLYSLLIRYTFLSYKILSTLFIALFLQQLRLQWYGLNYMGNVILFGFLLVLFIYFLKYITSKS